MSIDKLENFRRTNREQTDRQTDRQRIQNLRPLLSPWIVGVSGPITARTAAALYYTAVEIRKNAWNRQRTENREFKT